MDLVPLRQQVARALAELESRLTRLIESLAHSELTIEIDAAAGSSAVRRVCEAYSSINYAMKDDINTSVVCLGVVGAMSDIIKRAQAVNKAKADFKLLCAPLHQVSVRVPVKGETAPTRSISAMRVILRSIQRSDLNLLAAYRKLPILDAPPASVTYTRAHTRAVYRKAVEDIAVMLSTMESAAAIADRAKLEQLDQTVTHVALVKERYQNIRANVLYTRLDSRGRGRAQIAAELPLLYIRGRSAKPPEVHFLTDEPDSSRPQRSRQSKLETVPLLTSLPVYRYLSR